VNTNEETRLRNLLLKKEAGIKLKPLDILFINKLTAKKAAEAAEPKAKPIRTSLPE
jgi:hypothetical protein